MGPGTLILTGANSYGATTISAGTLQLDNGGTTGSLGAGAVVDNGTLAVDRSDATYIIGNNISGTGGIVSMAANALELTGAYTFSGPVTINSGSTLKATASLPWGDDRRRGQCDDRQWSHARSWRQHRGKRFELRFARVPYSGYGRRRIVRRFRKQRIGVQQNAVFNYITLDGDATVGGALAWTSAEP